MVQQTARLRSLCDVHYHIESKPATKTLFRNNEKCVQWLNKNVDIVQQSLLNYTTVGGFGMQLNTECKTTRM